MNTRAVEASLLFILILGALSPGISGQQTQTAVEKYRAEGLRAEQAGNLVEAEKIYLAAIEEAKQSNDPQLGNALANLANLYNRQGKRAQAIEYMKQALAADETNFGAEHSRVASDLNNLGMFYESVDQAGAEKCLKRALDILDNLPGPPRSQRYILINNLVGLYIQQHRYPDAEALLKPNIETLEDSPQPNGMELARLRSLLAGVYKQEGMASDASTLDSRAQEALDANQNSHIDSATLAMKQAQSYQHSGQLEAAEADYREVIAAWGNFKTDKVRGPYYPGLIPAALEGLGQIYLTEKRDAEAEDLLKRSLEVREQYASPSRQGMGMAKSLSNPFSLLNLYREQGRLNDMEPLYESALTVQEKVLGPEDSAVGETLINFARLYREEGKSQEAVPLYQRALVIQEKNEGQTLRLAATLEDYAGLLQDLGEEGEATAVRARAQAIRTAMDRKNK